MFQSKQVFSSKKSIIGKRIISTTDTATHVGSFIDFCRDHEDLLLISCASSFSAIPPIWGVFDNRFLISQLYCHGLESDFKDFLVDTQNNKSTTGYDMLFTDNEDHRHRISIKSNRTSNLFQRESSNGLRLTKPGRIVMRNFRGSKDGDTIYNSFDYLLAINALTEDNSIYIRFGAVDYNTVLDYTVEKNKTTDQWVVSIPNDAWSFLSRCERFAKNADPDKQNELFLTLKENMLDILLMFSK